MIPPKKRLVLFLKGFCMGTADIIPGVSGGTIALILGIYEELIRTISSINIQSIKVLLSFNFKNIRSEFNLDFLLPLFLGIFSAILLMARVMHYLFENYSLYTWSLFFGLIVGSIIFLLKQIQNLRALKNIISMIVGVGVGYMVISFIPISTPETTWFVFVSGLIGITAMILPGISGSFILLILGKYAYVTSAIKSPFNEGHLEVIFTFSFGCLVGLLSFSRVLKFFLTNYHAQTMCLLAGFMIGSLQKLWPWREVIEQKIIRGKIYILQEAYVLPSELSFQTILAFCIMFFAFTLIVFLEKIGKS